MNDLSKIVEFQKLVEQTKILCFDTETEGLSYDDKVIGISFATGNFDSPDDPTAFYIDFRDYDMDTLLQVIKPLFMMEGVTLAGHNIGFDLKQLKKLGITPTETIFDTLLAFWFTNPGDKNVGLKKLVKKIFGVELPTYKQMLHTSVLETTPKGKTKKKQVRVANLLEIDRQSLATYGMYDSFYAFKLYQIIKPKVDAMPSKELFYQIDMPLVKVLMDMEIAGMKIDTDKMKALADEMGTKLSNMHEELIQMAGIDINLESPKQLADLLFKTRGLMPLKNGKSGIPSTDEEVLNKYAKDGDEFCKLLTEYRQLAKMCGTYLDALPKQIASDGRLHPSFNIEGTATGRLSCDSPNLQNIPKEGELGKKIRNCFVPEEGHVFIRADYSMMEIRMLAHISGDERLIYNLRMGKDIHKETAKFMFDREDISEDERSKAKAVNFGIIFGMFPQTLAKRINVPVQDAKNYMAQYFRNYRGVSSWKWETIAYTRDNFKVVNELGRVRLLKLADGNLGNIALNSPIQGSCADLVKIAMIRLHKALEGTGAKIIVQVHDEVIVECRKEIADKIASTVKAMMESINIVLEPATFFSKCPFVVEVEQLSAWKEDKQ
jgi:DNA polymerase-1